MSTGLRVEITLPEWMKRAQVTLFPRVAMPPIPPLRDARYLQVAILLAYSLVARVYFNLESSVPVAIGCTVYACVVDLLFGVYLFRKPVFPLSSAIIGFSSAILVETHDWWGYFVVATIACLSKAFLRHDGRHYFNPTCFGVTVALMLFPNSIVAIPHLFSGYMWPSIVFGFLGVATVVYARQTVTSFSWLLGFIAFAFVRAWIQGANPMFIVGPAFAPASLLFAFHMISDPATTPRSVPWQIAFGVAAAALDAVLRYKQVPFGQFYGLAVVCAVLPWIRKWEVR